MKIWFISDTHGFHNQLHLPQADMVIHCGDESNHAQWVMNSVESRKFFEWYSSLPIPHKIFVPGNHSTAIQAGLIKPEDYPNIKFLIHDETIVDDIKIFGSPYTPAYGDWAYMKKRNRMELVWQSLPECDILVTHGPPKGILDLTRDRENNIIQVGCKSLYNKVMEVKPRIHAFGHIHDEKGINNYGFFKRGHTSFINCACWNHKENKLWNGDVYEI